MKQVNHINSAKRTLDIETKGLLKLSKNIGKDFSNLCDELLLCKGKIITIGVGKSGHIANKTAATLSSTGTPSHFVHPSEASHGDLGSIAKNDCILVFSNSGQSNELNDIMNYAKRFGIPLLSVSSNKNGLLSNNSNFTHMLSKPVSNNTQISPDIITKATYQYALTVVPRV